MVLEKGLGNPLDCKEIQPVQPKGNQSWIFIGRTDAEGETPNILATWCKELTPWKSPWCWERLKAGGEGDERGWDDWMASLTQWTWVWVNSGNWLWTGRPGVLQCVGSQSWTRLSDWTEMNWRWLSWKESAWECKSHRKIRFDSRKIPWRRKWQPTPVLLPGKSHGQRSLAGCSPWGCKRARHVLATKQQAKRGKGTTQHHPVGKW